jgi:hypothetical protein|tara:strand:+ start:338 stop:556 length:219 start_codon:yes stop_codon:yes gene_type:complete
MKKLLLLVGLCGCTTTQQVYDDTYRYYVMDVHGTEPDAVFDDRVDAAKYVEEFKEFHDYRIVKAQSYTNEND